MHSLPRYFLWVACCDEVSLDKSVLNKARKTAPKISQHLGLQNTR